MAFLKKKSKTKDIYKDFIFLTYRISCLGRHKMATEIVFLTKSLVFVSFHCARMLQVN